MKKLTRRDFLKGVLGTAGTLAASEAFALELLRPVRDPLGAYPYRGWESLYEDQWTYDTFGRSTHSVNCTGSCTWKGYVKNGILFKEEQYADFPEINNPEASAADHVTGRPYNPSFPDLSTYNPRGCQKGACFKEYVYGPQRLKYPLIRVEGSSRGEGKFRRASWEEALSLIASKVKETILANQWTDTDGTQRYGSDMITFFAAIPAKHFISFAGGARLANLIGGVVCSFYDWYCDLPPGEPITWAVQTDSCEAADWLNSKYIILWGANLLETRIPDAHFLMEAQANGARVVAIFPEYNPSSIHSDVYLPINPGTDGALALSMANVIVTLDLHDQPYLKQYTDMPFLVRTDNNKLLRESDIPDNPGFHRYYIWDSTSSSAVQAPGTMSNPGALDLGAVDPALEVPQGTMVNGIEVKTVFSRLKEKLTDPVSGYDPARAAAITGISAEAITQVAIDFATIKPARIIEGAGTNHYFHNDLINRAQILLAALTGNIGIPGGGFDHYVGQEKVWPEHGFVSLAYPLDRSKQRFQNMTLWSFVHSGIVSDLDTPSLNLLPQRLNDYIMQSVGSWWMPLYPEGDLTEVAADPQDPAGKHLENSRAPKILFVWAANYLNQAKGMDSIARKLFDTTSPKALDLVVSINFRLDTTSLFSDVILPSAGFFEKWDLNSTDLHTFIHPFTPVIQPLFESKTDWQIWRSLAGAIGSAFAGTAPLEDTFRNADGKKVSVVRNMANFKSDFDLLAPSLADPAGPPVILPSPGLAADEDACQYLLDNAEETTGMTLDQLAARPRRLIASGSGWTSDIKPNEAYYGFQRMFEKNIPLATMTGRQQFYIDHDWFLPGTVANPNGLGEELPVYKPPLDADDQSLYPLRWITPHGRWSIHSTWRDAKFQLRLQRGGPVVYLSPDEAARRGLQDNDTVEVFNSNGSFVARLYVSRRLPDGMAQMYHGWERCFFPDIKAITGGWQSTTIIRIKPTQLVGRYGHLRFKLNTWGPTGNQKDTRVDIRLMNLG